MEEYILYVIDTETTGLEVGKNEIIELSALRFYLNNPDTIEQKTWLIRALNASTISDEALAICGHKREDILHQTQFGRDNYIHPKDFVYKFDTWISSDDMSSHDRVFCGQNPLFDFNHMYAIWEANNSRDTFPFLTGGDALIQDTKSIALFIDILLGKKRERYNLGSLIKSFGIKKEKAHRADADVRMTKDLYCKFVELTQETIKAKLL